MTLSTRTNNANRRKMTNKNQPPTLHRLVMIVLLTGMAWSASAEPLQIKGRALGQSQKLACVGEGVTFQSIYTLVTQNQATIPSLKLTNSTSCDVPTPTFAGQPLDTEVTMLFVNDRLIQVKFEMSPLDWTPAAEFAVTTERAYGKPRRDRRNIKQGLMTDTWAQGPETLLMTWTTLKDGRRSVEVVLRDVPSFSAFQKIIDYNSKQFGRADSDARLTDTK